MPKLEELHSATHFVLLRIVTVLILIAGASCSVAQSDAKSAYYGRRNTFGIFVAYSNDSSHILLGDAENRKLMNIGVSYSRRLILNRIFNWQYSGELMPVVLESDPLSLYVQNQTSPTASTSTFQGGPAVACGALTIPYSTTDPATGTVYSGTLVISCRGRRWTVGQAMSPAGLQLNFLPRHKLQPFLIGHGGYMYSTQAIPIDGAGSFNFTFDAGVGLELYRSKSKSLRLEYRYHHISNNNTATLNPGIDNGLFQVTYAFGR
ncbi:MAG: acyloxyacyl hydrolase [Terracidiphilus sp.]